MSDYNCANNVGWGLYSKVLNLVRVGSKVLDVGCGNGKLGELIQNKELYGTEIDKSTEQICKSKGYNFHLSRIGDEVLPFEDKYFDTTFCLEVFQYISPEKIPFAIAELKRVTKGEVIISVPNYNCTSIRSIFSKKLRTLFFNSINKTHYPTNRDYLEGLVENIEIRYIYSRFEWVRSLWGNMFASEVVGIINEWMLR